MQLRHTGNIDNTQVNPHFLITQTFMCTQVMTNVCLGGISTQILRWHLTGYINSSAPHPTPLVVFLTEADSDRGTNMITNLIVKELN